VLVAGVLSIQWPNRLRDLLCAGLVVLLVEVVGDVSKESALGKGCNCVQSASGNRCNYLPTLQLPCGAQPPLPTAVASAWLLCVTVWQCYVLPACHAVLLKSAAGGDPSAEAFQRHRTRKGLALTWLGFAHAPKAFSFEWLGSGWPASAATPKGVGNASPAARRQKPYKRWFNRRLLLVPAPHQSV